jgi:drug/metabolite transporter (DMT)-like permease
MNYFKNTRKKGVPYDNKGFFAVEQLSASSTMFIATLAVIFFMTPDAANPKDFIANFQGAFSAPHEQWFKAALAGIPYGIGAFFSVFLFMFKGRTATFAGLVNRLTSLIAGTIATLLVFLLMAAKPPKLEDWLGLAIIFIAIYFLGLAEKKRACELALAHEIEPEKGSETAKACGDAEKTS